MNRWLWVFVGLVSVILVIGAVVAIKMASSTNFDEQYRMTLHSRDAVLRAAKETTWGKNFIEVPATVIDTGVLKHVPYVSYRSGDYEFNVYGDPENPSCLEIGIYNDGWQNIQKRKECADFLASILFAQAPFIESVSLDKGTTNSSLYTIEVTPSDAPDAYGAWWISIYDEKQLEQQRAKPENLTAIVTTVNDQTEAWTPSAISQSRVSYTPSYNPPRTVPQPSQNYSSSYSGGGQVYVRGYYRKDGTYVRPHTRRR